MEYLDVSLRSWWRVKTELKEREYWTLYSAGGQKHDELMNDNVDQSVVVIRSILTQALIQK